jgi:ribosomal protein L44E
MERLNCNEEYYQCAECGNIHRAQVDKTIDLDDDLHYATYCPKCKKVTKQLWVGEDKSDKYIYMDIVLDERYY